MNKKILKTGAFILATSMVAGMAYFANALVGNPVSRLTAQKKAEKYVAETYPDEGYITEDARYSFKDGKYNITVKNPDSMDKHFYLSYDFFGNLKYDSYEYYVVDKINTVRRVRDEYRELTKQVLNSSSFPLDLDFGYGELKIAGRDEFSMPLYMPNAMKGEDFQIDKLYDVRLLGKDMGLLKLYIYSDEITIDKLAEALLEVRHAFDESGVPFYAVDIVLTEPKKEDGDNRSRKEMRAYSFLYEDIWEDESYMARVEEQVKKTEEFFERMDEMKKEELINEK